MYIYNANFELMHQSTKYIFSAIIICLPLLSWAQSSKIKHRDRVGDSTILVNTQTEKERKKLPPLLSNEYAVGLKFNSDGWGLNLDYGIFKRMEGLARNMQDLNYNTRLFRLELGEVKHAKEYQALNGLIGNIIMGNGGYKYGKINNLYFAKIGFHNRKQIGFKENNQSTGLYWQYGAALIAGFKKPYMLNTSSNGYITYSDTTKNIFLNQGYILGSGGISKGWEYMEFIPGISLTSALHVDFTKRRKGKLALELGGGLDYYTKGVALMVEQKERSLYANIYLNIIFGWRKAPKKNK